MTLTIYKIKKNPWGYRSGPPQLGLNLVPQALSVSMSAPHGPPLSGFLNLRLIILLLFKPKLQISWGIFFSNPQSCGVHCPRLHHERGSSVKSWYLQHPNDADDADAAADDDDDEHVYVYMVYGSLIPSL